MKSDGTSIFTPDTYGSPWEAGFYGGRIVSHGGAKIYGIEWAPKALGEVTGLWLPSYKQVPNACSFFHSMDNTIAMAEAGSPIAQAILGKDINGKKDWCIPARDVLELGYRHLKPTAQANWASYRDGDNPSSLPPGYPYTGQAPGQTTAEAFREGGAEAFDAAWYWSSTQSSSGGAWHQYFRHGDQDTHDKKFEALARACRLILLNP